MTSHNAADEARACHLSFASRRTQDERRGDDVEYQPTGPTSGGRQTQSSATISLAIPVTYDIPGIEMEERAWVVWDEGVPGDDACSVVCRRAIRLRHDMRP